MYVVTEDWAKCGTTRRKIVANGGLRQVAGTSPSAPKHAQVRPHPALPALEIVDSRLAPSQLLRGRMYAELAGTPWPRLVDLCAPAA